METNKRKELMRMKNLIKILTAADIAYYRDDSPIMLDHEYDRLTAELQELEKTTGVVMAGSPLHKVSGEILDSLTPVQHSKPMLSADKTKNVEDIKKFAKGRRVMFSWKLDGLTLVLKYENGWLKQAITRGREGIIGEDVTHTVKHFINVPLCIPAKDYLEVRGEGVVSLANFDRINSTLTEPYSLPRAFASGSTRKLNAGEVADRCLEFIAFELVNGPIQTNSKEIQQNYLRDLGFSIVPNIMVEATASPDEIADALAAFAPSGYTHPTDGVIVEYDDLAYGKSLGGTGHHDNRMIAFKWKDDEYETKFLGVELATTRTGLVSLTGVFESVNMDGSNVDRAYLHNLDIFEDFHFGIGDTISVYKANQIIPQIAKNLTQSGGYQIPMICPCCGSALTVKTSDGGTRQLYCENPDCTAKLVRRFVHFCDKTRMNIEGLSEKTLEKLIGKGWIKNFADLYDLSRYESDIASMDGFGVKSCRKLLDSIERSRVCTPAQLISALGIPNIGRRAAKDIEKHFGGSWDAFYRALTEHYDFSQIEGFGQTTSDGIHAWFADKNELALWFDVLDCVVFREAPVAKPASAPANPFSGKTVVATGKLNGYTRDGIQEKLISLGATPSGSVTKNTDFLIVGEKAGSKLQKAQQLGVKTLSEEEFEALIKAK